MHPAFSGAQRSGTPNSIQAARAPGKEMDDYSEATESVEPFPTRSVSTYTADFRSPTHDSGSAYSPSASIASPSSDIATQPRRWGRIDAENEDNIPRLKSVSDDGLRNDVNDRRKMLGHALDEYWPSSSSATGW